MMYIFNLFTSEDTFVFFDIFAFSNRINSAGLSQSLVKIYKSCELKAKLFSKHYLCYPKSLRFDKDQFHLKNVDDCSS